MTDLAPVITIDGPAGAGKGTIAGLLASQLGWHLLDSGAIYRVAALAVMNNTERPTTCLFVVDETDTSGEPVGVVHMHDVLRAGVH